eukprot:TRINITY_DN2177_c0_g1_i2.p1 TRINITY_DN2177_c0_g1~~TRINITY_DN2177_c0_g1_i2.p1  ORF type:complete len:540 (-),score=188.92 TRINITY_DN2177_c0_g1_i2:24-1643(-)
MDSISKKEKRRSERKDKKERRSSRSKKDETSEGQTPEPTRESKKRSRSEGKSKDKSSKKAKRDSSSSAASTPVEKVEKKVEKKEEKKTEASSSSKSFLSNDAKAISTFRDANRISVLGDVTNFGPILDFTQTGFEQDLLACTKGFTKPTPIQSQTWPILLSGRDVVGIAETGSGKTLSFGLPGLAHVKKAKAAKKATKPIMLILAPTRELAQQSHDVLQKVGEGCSPKIHTVCVYGGVPKDPQRRAFKNSQADVVVACPGRLLDLIQEGAVDLSEVDYMVLDEADRMLDMGFERDIRQIFGMIQKKRQTLMFSATWPKSVQILAGEFLDNPIRVVVGSEDLTANSRVEQIVEVIDMEKRDDRLLTLLKQYHKKGEKIIVFVLYKKEAGRIETLLQRRGFNCCSIHGDKSSVLRAEALANFKKGSPPIMIATDVAARGLDIPKVEYVLNYSFPLTVEDYVHRIGRTGRAGATGISHTFFHKHDKSLSGELIGVLRQAKANIPEELLAFGTATKKKEPKLGKIDLNQTNSRITFDSDDDDM